MRRLAGEGRSLVFISHKLGEVLEICDRVVVLRDGVVAGCCATADATRDDLACLMVGRELPAARSRQAPATGAILFSATDMATGRSGQDVVLAGISFAVRSGEILAIAGIDGNGQTELAEALTGARPLLRGRIALAGQEIAQTRTDERLAAGLAYIPVDRGGTSLVPGMSVADNLALRDIGRPPFSRWGLLQRRTIQALAASRIGQYGIRCAGPGAPARSLSGGNQQKIVIARELGRRPQALIAIQPTWGLDPGATRFVQDAIRTLRDEGGAVLYVSAELEEVLELGDRVAVLHQGRLSRPRAREEVDLTRIGLLMAGDATAWRDDAVPLAA
jgi:simple sugar transport system ATP-binding protein